jgi:deazaflavin-dependent oxidoreductase (nitroreductase family)
VPLPRRLGRFNRRVTNPILWPIVQWLPGFVRIVHVGRRSGRVHRTPVLAFRHGERFLIAMTYGPSTDWARNVLAAGSARLETRTGTLSLDRPRAYRDPSHAGVPRLVRLVLGAIRADDVLELRLAEASYPPS